MFKHLTLRSFFILWHIALMIEVTIEKMRIFFVETLARVDNKYCIKKTELNTSVLTNIISTETNVRWWWNWWKLIDCHWIHADMWSKTFLLYISLTFFMEWIAISGSNSTWWTVGLMLDRSTMINVNALS